MLEGSVFTQVCTALFTAWPDTMRGERLGLAFVANGRVFAWHCRFESYPRDTDVLYRPIFVAW